MGWLKLQEAATKLPDLLLRGRLDYDFDGMPLVARLPVRKRVNLLKCGVDALLRSDRLLGMPPTIQVEPANVCNLKCPLCPTGANSAKRPKGFMSMETFDKLLAEVEDFLVTMVLYGWGEPFLAKDLPRMIEACSSRGILTVTSTNGHCLQTPEEALAVVDAGLTALVIALDGSTQEIYQAYRKSGSVDKVKRCVACVEEAKARRRAELPYTNLRVVVTSANQDDLPNIETLAREMGVNMFSYKSVGCLVEGEQFAGLEATDTTKKRYAYDGPARRRKAAFRCIYPFRQPTVFWDGTVVGCEFDYGLEAPWGDIRRQRLAQVWNGPTARALRRAVLDRSRRPNFCDLCPYRDRVQDSCILSCRELRPLHAPRAAAPA
ncbi:MAG: radical SAM protein [Planctomycetota bacterium]